jgi:hypothetical protein
MICKVRRAEIQSREEELGVADFYLKQLNMYLFPGLNMSIEARDDALNTHAATATDILTAVNDAEGSHMTSNITLVGHGTGGSLTLLDALYLHLNGPASDKPRTVTYRMPRVGNQACRYQGKYLLDAY